MSDLYSPNNWYWTIAGDSSRVYSSSRGDYLPLNDASYQTWLARDNKPSVIATEALLGEVLAEYVNFLNNKTSTSLDIQQALRQAELDALLVANADMVSLIRAGQSTTTTATTVATYLSNGTNNYRSLRAQIANAATPAAVRAININAGWPPNP